MNTQSTQQTAWEEPTNKYFTNAQGTCIPPTFNGGSFFSVRRPSEDPTFLTQPYLDNFFDINQILTVSDFDNQNGLDPDLLNQELIGGASPMRARLRSSEPDITNINNFMFNNNYQGTQATDVNVQPTLIPFPTTAAQQTQTFQQQFQQTQQMLFANSINTGLSTGLTNNTNMPFNQINYFAGFPSDFVTPGASPLLQQMQMNSMQQLIIDPSSLTTPLFLGAGPSTMPYLSLMTNKPDTATMQPPFGDHRAARRRSASHEGICHHRDNMNIVEASDQIGDPVDQRSPMISDNVDDNSSSSSIASPLLNGTCTNHSCLVCTRPMPEILCVNAPSWSSILRIVFYTLKVNNPQKEFFNLRSHVYDFVETHWSKICIGKTKSDHWRKQLQDTLAHNKKLFGSGTEIFKQKGFWKLNELTDPWTEKNPNHPSSNFLPLPNFDRNMHHTMSYNNIGGADNKDKLRVPMPTKQRAPKRLRLDVTPGAPTF